MAPEPLRQSACVASAACFSVAAIVSAQARAQSITPYVSGGRSSHPVTQIRLPM
jgi:hypothetical protein